MRSSIATGFAASRGGKSADKAAIRSFALKRFREKEKIMGRPLPIERAFGSMDVEMEDLDEKR
jgi:hypothetical protein